MSWLSQLWIEVRVRLFALVGRRRLRDRIDEEMRLHIEMRAEHLADGGLPSEEARWQARRGFGNRTVIREATLDMWRYGSMDVFLQDVRYGARLLLRNPIFALTAALSLAIGIGANTTVFSVANRLLLREPVGVADADRLVDIAPTSETGRFIEPFLSYRVYLEVRERATTLESVYGYHIEPYPMSLAGPGGAERIFSTFVTGNYFTALGVRPAAGRLFGAVDSEQPDAAPIAVLSHRFWTRRFNADPSVVGQTLRLTGRPFTVVGVASEGFEGTTVMSADMWLPVAMRSATKDQGPSTFLVGGRLKPGVSLRQAAAEVDAIGRVLRRESPRQHQAQGVFERPLGGLRVVAASALPPLLRLPITGFLAFLMGIVSLVLLIACANVAGVLLARATARRREIAVRLAIGAGRARLIRQLLTETLLLFVLGGALGVALARVMTSLLVSVLPSMPVPIDVSLPLDRRVLLFSAALSLISAVLSGLVPALQASKADVVSALKNDSQGPSDRLRLRSGFVVAQVAFSILLVVGAGLLTRALHRSGSVELGFDQHGVEVASMDLSLAGYTNTTGPAFIRELGDRLRKLPAVQDATMATALPTDPDRRQVLVRSGPGAPPADPQILADMPSSNAIAPGYFSTLRIPLVAGRDFTDADREGRQPVAIVSAAAARLYWPGQNAVGQYLRKPPFTSVDLLVVGVARDLTTGGSGDPRRPTVYLPLQQKYQSRFAILARSTQGQRIVGEIRALIASMDPNLPIVHARTLEDQTSPMLVQLRLSASVSGTVGLVGLLLAAIGVYGVTAYAVTRRTREIGIRIAMGAQRRDVLRMVMGQGMWLVSLGSGLGLLLAAAGSRLLQRLLFGVPPLDPLTFGGAAMLFAVIGLAACYVPARRATRIDATEALRAE